MPYERIGDDRGLALWNAVLDAARRWPHQKDVMGVGVAGDEVVVIRVHAIDKNLVIDQAKGVNR